MQLLRLSGRKVCDRLIRQGNVWRGKHILVRWVHGAPRTETQKGIFIGMLASTKLDKSAVKRNRMRRRCREAFRLITKDMPQTNSSMQLLVSPRSSSLTCDFPALQDDARRFLSLLPR